MQWFLDWGEAALIHAVAIGQRVFRSEWNAINTNGWIALAIWLAVVAAIKRIRPLYNWPRRLLLTKRAAITVTPAGIVFNGQRFEHETVGQLAVMPHSEIEIEKMREQERREKGRKPTGKWRYFQNAFQLVMPYYGEPVVVLSMYGSKLRADQVAARIMLARQLAAQHQTADADEFGPSPSLPDDEEESPAAATGGFWRRMGLGG